MRQTTLIPLIGEFQEQGDALIFQGRPSEKDSLSQANRNSSVGQVISSQALTDGSVGVNIEFKDLSPDAGAGIFVSADPADHMITALLGGMFSYFSIQRFESNSGWSIISSAGDRSNLRANRNYRMDLQVRGSQLRMFIDGVSVLAATIPQLQSDSGRTQVGLFCRSESAVVFSDFRAVPTKPKAFVVMQFSAPYDELYRDVVVPVCLEMGLQPERADERYNTGMILAEINELIETSKVIVADITPPNPNVYYEVGYAHALKKPTVLIADRDKLQKMPFDVSPFRTLFYENSIGGKKKVEEGLRRFLQQIVNPGGSVSGIAA